MTAPLLSLVPIDAHREPEQLMLQPVALILPFVVPEPWLVRCARRRTAKVRCAAAAPAVQASPYPGDLETYRAPRRARRSLALHAYAPRRQRAGARPRSVGLEPLTPEEKAELAADEAELAALGIFARPAGEGDADCANIADPEPCPWLGCRVHLGKEVNETTGALKVNHPDREVWDIPATCTFRVVRDRGGISLEEVGKLVNLTQEGVRKIEEAGKAKAKLALAEANGIGERGGS